MLDGVCAFTREAQAKNGLAKILFVSESGNGRGETRAASCLAGCLVDHGMSVQDAIQVISDAAGTPSVYQCMHSASGPRSMLKISQWRFLPTSE